MADFLTAKHIDAIDAKGAPDELIFSDGSHFATTEEDLATLLIAELKEAAQVRFAHLEAKGRADKIKALSVAYNVVMFPPDGKKTSPRYTSCVSSEANSWPLGTGLVFNRDTINRDDEPVAFFEQNFSTKSQDDIRRFALEQFASIKGQSLSLNPTVAVDSLDAMILSVPVGLLPPADGNKLPRLIQASCPGGRWGRL